MATKKATTTKVVKVPEVGAKPAFQRVTVTAAQEKEILSLLADGKSRREVSEAVGLSQMQIDKVRKAHGLHTPRVKKAAAKKPAAAKSKTGAPEPGRKTA
jgi:hypothetical protein